MQSVKLTAPEPSEDFSWPLQAVATAFGLETPRGAARVAGGLLHRLWRVEIASQAYALKVLSRRAAGSDAGRAGLERAEEVAALAARAGIPALTALRGQNRRFLQSLGDDWMLLFPWRDGAILPPSAASPENCAAMGEHLGTLHALKIRFPDQNAPLPEAFENDHFERLLERGERENAIWAGAVRENLTALTQANRRAMRAQLQLQRGWVTGHLDFDQKNVLWHDGFLLILDWEAAKPIHPALELLGAGLSWAGQSAGEARRDSFEAFLQGYRRKNQVADADLATACDAVLGKWVIWLEFNLRRSLEAEIRGTGEAKICHDALFHALGATLQLQNDVPLYRSWCEQS